jgi:thymidylate synthase
MNHLDAVKEQLSRTPNPLPSVTLNSDVDSIDGFKMEDLQLNDYNPHPAIKAPMAV